MLDRAASLLNSAEQVTSVFIKMHMIETAVLLAVLPVVAVCLRARLTHPRPVTVRPNPLRIWS